jgi:myo-inositol-1-phosphate synthase
MNAVSANGQVGVWLIGGRGSVATTTVVGAAAVAEGLAEPTALVTMRSPFSEVGLPALERLVFGGHDVVQTPLAERAAALVAGGVLPVGLPEAVGACVEAAEAAQRPGITSAEAHADPRAAVNRVADDLQAFRDRHDLGRVVVLNVSSTEAPVEPHPAHGDAGELIGALDRGLGILPPSSLYALAAIQAGCAFIDFTPSTGARLPALEALAEANAVPLAGRDGKTGETFLKSALAPALATRALRVRSWAGTNLLGGGDGAALAEPARARSKMASKGRCVEEILFTGPPASRVIRVS